MSRTGTFPVSDDYNSETDSSTIQSTVTLHQKYSNKNQIRGKEQLIEVSTIDHRENQSPVVDNIQHYEKNLSLSDDFIKKQIDYSKVKIFDKKYRYENERLKSLDAFPKELDHLKKPIAKSGFYYRGNAEYPDRVKCIFCKVSLSLWRKTDNPKMEHKKYYPNCPFLLNFNVGNVPIGSGVTSDVKEDPDLKGFSGLIPYNVIKHTEKYNIYDDYIDYDLEYREKTFANVDYVKHLAWDGLYITEKISFLSLRCIKCHKEVELLEGVEHLDREVFHRSDCEYYKAIKIEKLEKENNNMKNKSVTCCKVEYSITEGEIDAKLDLRLTNKNGYLNIDLGIIRKLIESNLKNTGKDYETRYDFFKDMKHFVEKKEYESDNNSLDILWLYYSCVVCHNKPRAVVLLPCGHLKTCKSCSFLSSKCPVCKNLIDRRICGLKIGRD